MIGEIKNTQGERIDHTFHAGAPGARHLVVLGHGVTGNKDRPFLVALAEGLAAAGIPALRISFSGNGASGGRFVDSNITKEVADLGAVLDAFSGYSICYAGHSLGGAVGVLRACADPRIHWLISLAGMVHTAAFAQREFGMVKPGEGCMWDEPSCPLSAAFMNDLNGIKTVVHHAARIRVPWLLVHGTADDVVPIQDSHDIFAQANEPKEFIQIAGAGHMFAEAFTPVLVETVVRWVKQRFARGEKPLRKSSSDKRS